MGSMKPKVKELTKTRLVGGGGIPFDARLEPKAGQLKSPEDDMYTVRICLLRARLQIMCMYLYLMLF